MKKYKGILTYNQYFDRMDILYDDGTTEGGLHCGVCLEVKINGRYKPTRLEKSDEWYLVDTGLHGVESMVGLTIRI